MWNRFVIALAYAQVLLGLSGVATLQFEPHYDATRVLVSVLQIIVCIVTGTYLLLDGEGDERAVSLGVVLLLMASSFSYGFARPLESATSSIVSVTARAFSHVREDALVAAFFWGFAKDFPRVAASRTRTLSVRAIVTLCTAVGIALIAVNVCIGASVAPPILSRFDASNSASLYWPTVYGLLLPALPFMLWNARSARGNERRRVRLFVVGLCLSVGPFVLYIVAASTIPEVAALREAGRLSGVTALLRVLLLAVPVTTAYSVLVDQVFDLGLVVRSALRYALARSILVALVALPVGWLLALIYARRGETIADAMTGWSGLRIYMAVALGASIFMARHRAIAIIDRAFFREHYDSRRVLSGLLERSRIITDLDGFVQVLELELDRALHPDPVVVFVRNQRRRAFVPLQGTAPPLKLSSDLAYYLTMTPTLVEVNLRSGELPFADLSEGDLQWISAARVRLLVPIVGADGRLKGMISLGPKRSELPFTADDKEMLSAVGAAAGLALERLLRDEAETVDAITNARPATECPQCETLSDPDVERCELCGAATRVAIVPRNLAGKFRIEKRVGTGAMGVVYRATDVALGRSVAIKALPRTTPNDAVLLRREARAMASIEHPNLALIFGAETWRGYPLLVLEYLEGGTLTDLVAERAVTIPEACEIGVCVANALHVSHTAGLLHGDVKPSNIGFTSRRVPKLLDFGLAKLYGADVHGLEPERDGIRPGEMSGTTRYMSPEALGGFTPSPTFDLWSLSVVLYETIARRNPFQRASHRETTRAILDTPPADIRVSVPECPTPIAEFLARELSSDLRQRSKNAHQFADRLNAAWSSSQ